MSRQFPVRVVLLGLAGMASVGAGVLYLQLIGGARPTGLDWVRAALLTATSFWLIWGGATGVLGALLPARRPQPDLARPDGLTAVLVPIYNEDPAETFSRIAAMNRSLLDHGVADRFHFVVLSDSNTLEAAASEAMWFDQLVREPHSAGRMFYRRRERNVGRKAGNIEDFVVRSGGAYDYAIILDADSLMDGATLTQMARRMDTDARLGLLQTVPVVIDAETLFGRMMAFASAYLSPAFSRGAARLQGEQGPYWGHNAIVRMSAFAACCGLPVLGGKPPGGGHILSHDYVEAALLARGGWTVEVDPSLGGSFENGPENIVEYAKRDRRWCQGNLQHRRLVGAPGMHWWSRFTFIQGMMAYLASPLWLALMLTSLLATALPRDDDAVDASALATMAGAILAVLLLPKFGILIRGAIDGHNRAFGGSLRVTGSILAEILLSTLLAPVMMAFQTRAVFEFYSGLDGGWPATERNAARLGWRDAIAASGWIVIAAALVVGPVLVFAPAALVWLLPVLAPALCAPALVVLTSRSAAGWPLFRTAVERATPDIVLAQRAIHSSWTQHGPELPAAPAMVGQHALA